MGGKDFLLETLNRIVRLELYKPTPEATPKVTRAQVAPQELAAMRIAAGNGTITQGWVESLIKSSKDLQPILNIALE